MMIILDIEIGFIICNLELILSRFDYLSTKIYSLTYLIQILLSLIELYAFEL